MKQNNNSVIPIDQRTARVKRNSTPPDIVYFDWLHPLFEEFARWLEDAWEKKGAKSTWPTHSDDWEDYSESYFAASTVWMLCINENMPLGVAFGFAAENRDWFGVAWESSYSAVELAEVAYLGIEVI